MGLRRLGLKKQGIKNIANIHGNQAQPQWLSILLLLLLLKINIIAVLSGKNDLK